MQTAYFQAVENGNIEEVQSHLSNDQMLANAENEHGLTALGLASHYGHIEMVRQLLAAGAEINAMSHSLLPFIPSNTALHAAISGRQPAELISLLIEHGADVNAIDSEGHKPIQTAAFEGNVEIAKRLLENGADPATDGGQGSAVAIADKRGNEDFASLLRASVNAINR
ncbi:ankyrin repeat domain-containing protein [Fictibacillus iocasae]|uniref:Ankyrin repeat domain-containing protein n=1 Tax=Fictibacillus iocasae TaxID=2715437 RepID=A0ABW2NRW3_9BACL